MDVSVREGPSSVFDPKLPIYYQLMEILRDEIEKGQYKPGDALPSENELTIRFGVSRPTVRQAVNELVREGLLYRIKGKGTFVAQPKIVQDFFQKLLSFAEEMREKGLEHRTEVLGLDVRLPQQSVSEHLRLPYGRKIIRLERVRFINEEPIVHVTSYIPWDYFPGMEALDFTNLSLYQVMEERWGARVSMARRWLEAVPATARSAGVLKIREGAPVQLCRTVTWDDKGRAVEYSVASYRGDRSQFILELRR